jgi:HrpA-like RNA helicase
MENVLNRHDSTRSFSGSAVKTSYHQLSAKEKQVHDFDYVKMRTQFENELRGIALDDGGLNSTVYPVGGSTAHSVVGSNMSQLESVSAMSGATAMQVSAKLTANHLAKMHIAEEADENSELAYVDDNNNANVERVGGLLKEADAGRLVPPRDEEAYRLLHTAELRKKYKVLTENEYANLPIRAERTRIVDCVEANKFVIIEGGTGCGKST